jgi:hypothetical protein
MCSEKLDTRGLTFIGDMLGVTRIDYQNIQKSGKDKGF